MVKQYLKGNSQVISDQLACVHYARKILGALPEYLFRIHAVSQLNSQGI